MSADEEWRPTPGWPYEVSNYGQVRRAENSRVLSPEKTWNGYLRVSLGNQSGTKRQRRFVHHLVCLAFKGDPPSPMHEVAHADGDSTNNAAHNLRWATRLENARDKWTHKTMAYGDRAGAARLTWEKANDIRFLFYAGTNGAKGVPPGLVPHLCNEFGMGRSAIDRMVRFKTWRGKSATPDI